MYSYYRLKALFCRFYFKYANTYLNEIIIFFKHCLPLQFYFYLVFNFPIKDLNNVANNRVIKLTIYR